MQNTVIQKKNVLINWRWLIDTRSTRVILRTGLLWIDLMINLVKKSEAKPMARSHIKTRIRVVSIISYLLCSIFLGVVVIKLGSQSDGLEFDSHPNFLIFRNQMFGSWQKSVEQKPLKDADFFCLSMFMYVLICLCRRELRKSGISGKYN